MPVVQKSLNKNHPAHDRLVAEISRHLRGGADLPDTPRIVESEDRLSQNMHVVVLWDEWDSVSERERADIILSAYKDVQGQAAMLRISVAMGVTPVEAYRLGMHSLLED